MSCVGCRADWPLLHGGVHSAWVPRGKSDLRLTTVRCAAKWRLGRRDEARYRRIWWAQLLRMWKNVAIEYVLDSLTPEQRKQLAADLDALEADAVARDWAEQP